MTCNECIYFNPENNKCNKYKSFTEPNVKVDCKHFNSEQEDKYPNKGVKKRDQKRARNYRKMRMVKENQESICRFVRVEYMTFHIVNRKIQPYKTVRDVGLQISNKLYLNNGRFKFINNKNLKIKKIYPSIPYCLVNKNLIDQYEQFRKKNIEK